MTLHGPHSAFLEPSAIGLSAEWIGLLALALACPGLASIAVGSYRLVRATLESSRPESTGPVRSTRRRDALCLIVIGIAILVAVGGIARALL